MQILWVICAGSCIPKIDPPLNGFPIPMLLCQQIDPQTTGAVLRFNIYCLSIKVEKGTLEIPFKAVSSRCWCSTSDNSSSQHLNVNPRLRVRSTWIRYRFEAGDELFPRAEAPLGTSFCPLKANYVLIRATFRSRPNWVSCKPFAGMIQSFHGQSGQNTSSARKGETSEGGCQAKRSRKIKWHLRMPERKLSWRINTLIETGKRLLPIESCEKVFFRLRLSLLAFGAWTGKLELKTKQPFPFLVSCGYFRGEASICSL